MQINSRQEVMRTVTANADEIVASVPLSTGTVFQQMWLTQEVIAEAKINVEVAVFYGVAGYVFMHPDPDTAITLDILWDRMVPKDQAMDTDGGFDLDNTATDAEPEFEVGQGNINAVIATEVAGTTEFFRRRKRISAGFGVPGFVAGTPDLYLPVDNWRVHLTPMMRVDRPSMAMVAFSSPALDITEAPSHSTPAEHEWVMLQFLEVFLFDMWKQILGLIETGAESPYAEAAGFIAQLLEQTVQEETAGAYGAPTWTVFTSMTAQIDVEGTPEFRSLTSEG